MEFSWKNEIREFLDEKYILNCEFEKEFSKSYVILKILTLEKKIWRLECNISNGIKILNEDENLENLKNKVFESFEGLLSKISPLYKRKFFMDLNQI